MNDDDEIKGVIAHTFASTKLKESAAYLQRGRQYKGLSESDLQLEFMQKFRHWSSDVRTTRVELDDLTSEYSLRDIEPPYEDLKPEIDAMAEQIGDFYKGMTDEGKRKIGEHIITDYLDDLDKKQ